MAENTAIETELEAETSYTTESVPAKAVRSRGELTQPGAGTGRRKEAVARVRIMPGTGGLQGRELLGGSP